MAHALDRRHVQVYDSKAHFYGTTSYSTFLARECVCLHVPTQSAAGGLVILPPSGRSADIEDLFVLQRYFGIATTLEEPRWVGKLKAARQAEVEQQIANKKDAAVKLDREVTDYQARLVTLKRRYRLLYDDGDSLEAIVKEGFELLGASVRKVSKEKDDFRIKVPSYPEAVMEVKGTQNAKIWDRRSEATWRMDG